MADYFSVSGTVHKYQTATLWSIISSISGSGQLRPSPRK